MKQGFAEKFLNMEVKKNRFRSLYGRIRRRLKRAQLYVNKSGQGVKIVSRREFWRLGPGNSRCV